MSLEFTTNTLVRTTTKSKPVRVFTICHIFPDRDKVALVERSAAYVRRPEIHSANTINQKIKRGTLEIFEEIDERLCARSDELFPVKHCTIRNDRYDIIKPIVTEPFALEHYLLGISQSHIIHAQVEKHQISKKSFYHFLHRYLAYGSVPNALLPNYTACGRSLISPKNANDPGKKRGRPPVYSKLDTRNWTKEDTKFLGEFWSRVKRVAYKSNQDLYIEFCLQRFGAVINRDEARRFFQIGETESKLVSQDQFEYHFAKHIDYLDYIRRKKGASDFDNNRKATAGSARHGVRGSGDLYQVDATTSSINLLWSKSETKRLSCGRPTLYVVVDVYSTMIVGIHVSLNAPKWDAVGEALFNAFMDKADFCKEFNFPIEESAWPCKGIPVRVGMDRDPAHSANNLESVLKANFGIQEIELYPAYSGWAKGINERAVGTLEKKNKKLDAAIHENNRVDAPHPSSDALYTYRDYVKALIREVIAHNNRSFKPHLLDSESVKHTLNPTPLVIWNNTKDKYMGKRRPVSDQKIRFALLSEAKATLTQHGIQFKHRYYVNQKCNPEFARARSLGRCEVQIRHSTTTTNCIWWRDGKDCVHKLVLSAKSQAYADTNEVEANMLYQLLKEAEAESARNQHAGNMYDAAEQNADESKMRERVKGMKNREALAPDKDLKTAKKLEAAEENIRNAKNIADTLSGNAPANDEPPPKKSRDDRYDTASKRANKVFEERRP